MTPPDPIRLHPADVAAIAAEVARLVVEQPTPVAQPPAPRLVAADEVARALDVGAGWVRANAASLGGTRLGTGSKPRWRFDLARALEAATGCTGSSTSSDPAPPSPAAPVLSREQLRRGRRAVPGAPSARLAPDDVSARVR